jgi:hypothetical protein
MVLPRPASVEDLMAQVCRTKVTVERWDRLEPYAVARALVSQAGGSRTLIVKWLRDDPADTRGESWRLGTELAALRFLADDLGLDLAPRVIAADLTAGFLVLEDLAPRIALDQLICRDGAEAHRERLAAFAHVLGELGALTAGHADKYPGSAADPRPRLAALWTRAHEDAAAIGVPVAGPVAAELTAALDELAAPGPFLALGNGDAEANNCLVRASGPADARLIDFETARYGHALLDAVCLHVPGPRWMSVGDPAATGLADHYRRALAQGVPEAQDDRLYGFALTAACASWALLRLQRFAQLDRRAPGDHSRLQLVETVESAARAATVHRALPELAGWFRRAGAALRRRWPDADVDLTDPAAFPPYSPRR